MDSFEPFAQGTSSLHRLDPRVKIVVACLFSFVVAFSYDPIILGVSLLSAVSVLFAATLPLRDVLRRLAVVNGFIAVLWVFLPFTTPGRPIFSVFGLNASLEGVTDALLITIKSNSIVIACVTLLGTSSVFSLVHALQGLRVPDKLVHMFFFSYRYIHVIHREYVRLHNAMKVRCFRPRNNLHTYRSLAYLIGMLFLKSHERSQRIYHAMLCRGFKGRFYTREQRVVRGRDWLFLILSLLFITGLVVVQWIP